MAGKKVGQGFPDGFIQINSCIRKDIRFQVLEKSVCVIKRVVTLVSEQQMSKGLVSLLVSSCLSVWSGNVHLLLCIKSFDSKFSSSKSVRELASPNKRALLPYMFSAT
jgi:hypothetical protein